MAKARNIQTGEMVYNPADHTVALDGIVIPFDQFILHRISFRMRQVARATALRRELYSIQLTSNMLAE